MKTRTQKFASLAMGCVLKRAKESQAREYKARADSFPTMVLQAGLTQALGFLLSKEIVYIHYVSDLARVIGRSSAETLHEEAVNSDLPTYRRLTREVLEAAVLIKRYAQIQIKTSKEAAHARAGS
jgi:CRISPR-associated protein Cmr5